MKGYAYFDNSHVLHVVDDKNAAARNTSGKVVETELSYVGGYPVIDSKDVIYYADTNKAYVDGNKAEGKEISVPDPIRALVEELK